MVKTAASPSPTSRSRIAPKLGEEPVGVELATFDARSHGGGVELEGVEHVARIGQVRTEGASAPLPARAAVAFGGHAFSSGATAAHGMRISR